MANLIFERNLYPRSKPKVTIGICVKNCERYVRDAINSIIKQDFPHELIEVIVVDDGSEDKTLPVVLNLASKLDMHVKIYHSPWIGLGSARNIVAKNARGKYIIWVDGDMVVPKDHVRKQVEFMERNPEVGIAKARHAMLEGETIVGKLENFLYMILDNRPEILSSKLPGTGGAIYRVEAIKKVGGFDSNLKGAGEDQDIAYRIKSAGWAISQSSTFFYERRARTWKDLWNKYFWYGYGAYKLYRKNRSIFSIYKMNPLSGFIAGIFFIHKGYALIHDKSILLWPLHFAFKMMAWLLGFNRARCNNY